MGAIIKIKRYQCKYCHGFLSPREKTIYFTKCRKCHSAERKRQRAEQAERLEAESRPIPTHLIRWDNGSKDLLTGMFGGTIGNINEEN